MKNLRKMTALLLSAVMLLCIFCVPASAAGEKSQLITASLDSIMKDIKSMYAAGQDLYLFSDGTQTVIYRMDDAVLKSWRSTGKLKPKKISLDKKLSGKVFDFYTYEKFNGGGYGVVTDGEKNSVIKYNKTAGKISVVYASENYLGVTNSGIISECSFDAESAKLTVNILNAAGKKIKKLEYDGSGVFQPFTPESKYMFFAGYAPATGSEEEQDLGRQQILYLVAANGKVTEMARPFSVVGATADFYVYYQMPFAGLFVHMNGINKTTWLETVSDKAGKNYYSVSSFLKTNGKRTILYIYDGDNKYSSEGYACLLSAVGSTKNSTVTDTYDSIALGKPYVDMNTFDYKLYLVSDKSGKWGYINANGKQLAMFDDAAAFGKNASYSVAKSGDSVYVIDRSMKQASEKLKVGDKAIWLLDDDKGQIFVLQDGEKPSLMTYKGSIAA